MAPARPCGRRQRCLRKTKKDTSGGLEHRKHQRMWGQGTEKMAGDTGRAVGAALRVGFIPKALEFPGMWERWDGVIRNAGQEVAWPR